MTALSAAARQSNVHRLVTGSVETLLATWSREHGLFPYSSRIVGEQLVNDFAHPLAVRYTLNSLFGLARAAHAGEGPELRDVQERFASFHAAHAARIATLADNGLLALLQAELGETKGATEALAGIHRWDASSRNVVMQDLAWALWGAVGAHRVCVPGADAVAITLLARIKQNLVSQSGLPFHSDRRYRRRVVSFGAVTYFLRALHEAATAFEDEDAERLFRAGLERMLALQGPLGDWPWMIDPVSGRALDRYPVFAVHQDSMAMLFLLPALDRGLDGVEQAVDRSLDWALGRNELGIPMYVDDPIFFAFRSIERRERAPRARRFLRSSANVVTRRPARTEGAPALRLNSECRSYHLGWILNAWCGRLEETEDR